ncbi:hypothetical protein KAR28_00950 [Candidatus Parcubacteria bacterium]|nr:hypothetical protein [Candidatus Parcubacteria bacterium]
MGSFNRGDKFHSKKRFSGDSGRGRSDRSERPRMHQAICSECGKKCEVPFKPNGSKPIFCSDCFSKKESTNNNRFERRDSKRSDFRDKKMFDAVCSECGQACEVPFRPTSDKPVFCNNCFGKRKNSGSSKKNIIATAVIGSDQHKKQFEVLNGKLDEILKMLTPKNLVKEKIKKEKVNVKKAVKEVANKDKEKKVVAKKRVVKKAVAKKKVVKKAVAKKKAPASKKPVKKNKKK